MAVDFHHIFSCVRLRMEESGNQDFIYNFLPIKNKAIANTMAFSNRERLSALCSKHLFCNRKGLFPTDTNDSDSTLHQCGGQGADCIQSTTS